MDPLAPGWIPVEAGADPVSGKCLSGSWFRWFRAISDAFPYGAEIPFQCVQYRPNIRVATWYFANAAKLYA